MIERDVQCIVLDYGYMDVRFDEDRLLECGLPLQLRLQLAHVGDYFNQFVMVDLFGVRNRLQAIGRQLLEIIFQYVISQRGRLFVPFGLQHQKLLQIAGTDTGRIQLLQQRQGIQHFRFLGRSCLRNLFQLDIQIAVIGYISDEKQHQLSERRVFHVQINLFMQKIIERLIFAFHPLIPGRLIIRRVNIGDGHRTCVRCPLFDVHQGIPQCLILNVGGKFRHGHLQNMQCLSQLLRHPDRLLLRLFQLEFLLRHHFHLFSSLSKNICKQYTTIRALTCKK